MNKLLAYMAAIQAKIAVLLPQDKLLHFIGGNLIAATCVALGLPSDTTMLIVLAIAVLKEILDEIRYHGFDIMDILATALGPVPLLATLAFRGL